MYYGLGFKCPLFKEDNAESPHYNKNILEKVRLIEGPDEPQKKIVIPIY